MWREMSKPKYKEDFPLRAEGYAREELIDEQIAAKLGISTSTYYEYQKQHPEFSEAIKRGKWPVDVEVENALLKRAKGYEYEETTIEYIPGKKDKKLIAKKVKKMTKQVVPDVAAQKLWLTNRNPAKWRDRQEFGLGAIEDDDREFKVTVIHVNDNDINGDGKDKDSAPIEDGDGKGGDGK